MTDTMSATDTTWVDRDLYPFADRFVEASGHRVHYVDEGDGPILLMLHGNPTWSFLYRDVITQLRGSFRCVALDYPGFGLSTAADGFDGRPDSIAVVVEEVVDALDLRDFVVVVQDWGGPIGLRVAERQPDRIRGLVIANTWAWPITGDRHFERFSSLMGGRLGTLLTRRLNLFVNVMIPVGHRRRSVSGAEMRHYRSALDTPARREASAVLPREITASARFLQEVADGLAALRTKPALIVWADGDIAFGEKELSRWMRELPTAEVHDLAGAGHFVPSDAPVEFAGAIEAWFGRSVSA